MAEIVNYSPVADLKAQWKRNSKEELYCFCQNTKRHGAEIYFERYYRNGWYLWFCEKNEPSCLRVSKPYENRPLQF
jgi:hypothetical protein